jgi:hypothetical protein
MLVIAYYDNRGALANGFDREHTPTYFPLFLTTYLKSPSALLRCVVIHGIPFYLQPDAQRIDARAPHVLTPQEIQALHTAKVTLHIVREHGFTVLWNKDLVTFQTSDAIPVGFNLATVFRHLAEPYPSRCFVDMDNMNNLLQKFYATWAHQASPALTYELASSQLKEAFDAPHAALQSGDRYLNLQDVLPSRRLLTAQQHPWYNCPDIVSMRTEAVQLLRNELRVKVRSFSSQGLVMYPEAPTDRGHYQYMLLQDNRTLLLESPFFIPGKDAEYAGLIALLAPHTGPMFQTRSVIQMQAPVRMLGDVADFLRTAYGPG